jgi:hypothetical protein
LGTEVRKGNLNDNANQTMAHDSFCINVFFLPLCLLLVTSVPPLVSSDETLPLRGKTSKEDFRSPHNEEKKASSSNDESPTPKSKSAHRHGHDHYQHQHQHQMVYIPQQQKKPWIDKTICTLTILASVLAFTLCLGALAFDASSALFPHNTTSTTPTVSPEDLFDDLGRYVVEDYDAATPFSDFLPGLAGIYGKPLYAFFVNRGQGIASFGVESKDYPIMEFNSANKAYQNTPLLGFRTFIQGRRGTKDFLTEPFSPLTTNHGLTNKHHRLPKRRLYTGENEMQIQELDSEHHLETNVTYFVLPEEDFGAFVRRTTITNTHSKQSVTISLLDGLARMEPAGGKLDEFLKHMGRTLEGWMGVYFPYTDSITMPFYRLSTEPKDTASVKVQERGHYCLGILEGDGREQNRLLPIVYDTSKVFGEDTTMLRPIELYSKSVRDIINNPQYGRAKTSSCFAAGKREYWLDSLLFIFPVDTHN